MDDIPSSEFDHHDFDARDFVQRYRKRIPLPQLQRGLRAHHAATRQELIELINEKYADFVSLSSRMQGVERALRPLRAPLEESCSMTRGLRTKLGALLAQADEAHENLAKVRDRKDALASYIENAKLLDKAKESASERWGNPQESDDFLREHVAQENIARDLRRIRLSLGGKPRRGGHTPSTEATQEQVKNDALPPEECAGLLKEAAEFEDIFAGRLHERLSGLVASAKRSSESVADSEKTGVTPTGPPRLELLALAHVSRALVTLGRTDAVEAVFAQVFVQPALQNAIAACTKAAHESQGRGPAETGATNLGPFFDYVSASLLSENSALLKLTRRLCGSTEEFADGINMDIGMDDEADGLLDGSLLEVPGLCLVANAVVGPVLQHVQQIWPNVFMPAFPNAFAANCVHAASFIREAEALMTPSERRNFAASHLLLDFRKRWKTQVYMSLRTKEAMQLLDTAAAKSRASALAVSGALADQPPHVVTGHGFWLDVSAEVIRVLGLVWSDGWYLDAICPKALQLSLEIIARYGQAVQSLVVVDNNADPPHAGGWDAKSVPPTWAPSSWPVQLSRACADVMAVQSSIRGSVEVRGSSTDSVSKWILRRLPAQSGQAGADGRAGEIIGTLLGEACDGLEPVLRALEAGMLRQVVSAACKEFGAIRGIPAFYRMLNKPVPTKATAYVDSALRPMKALMEVSAKVAPDLAVKGWLQHAVDKAAAEFSVQAAQLLESEASLKKRLGARGGGESQVSDLEKIHIQLSLDVEAFTTGAAALGATATQAPGLAKLAEAVEPIRATFEAHRTA